MRLSGMCFCGVVCGAEAEGIVSFLSHPMPVGIGWDHGWCFCVVSFTPYAIRHRVVRFRMVLDCWRLWRIMICWDGVFLLSLLFFHGCSRFGDIYLLASP